MHKVFKLIHVFSASSEACTLPKVGGPCKGSYQNWYYEPETDSCHTFNYSGCLGNNNRFDSKKLCESTCVKHASLGELIHFL